MILILCSRHSGLLLFFEQSKLGPCSGPLHLLFSLPGRHLPGSLHGWFLLILQTLVLVSLRQVCWDHLSKVDLPILSISVIAPSKPIHMLLDKLGSYLRTVPCHFITCSMLYPGSLVEDLAHSRLSVYWVYQMLDWHSVLRMGLAVKETRPCPTG